MSGTNEGYKCSERIRLGNEDMNIPHYDGETKSGSHISQSQFPSKACPSRWHHQSGQGGSRQSAPDAAGEWSPSPRSDGGMMESWASRGRPGSGHAPVSSASPCCELGRLCPGRVWADGLPAPRPGCELMSARDSGRRAPHRYGHLLQTSDCHARQVDCVLRVSSQSRL